ncbi:MAG: hypothetical protein ABIJ56_03165 [Pseudomonadota bacterium]|nr:hypothetical protein [Myxococcota bacterium]
MKRAAFINFSLRAILLFHHACSGGHTASDTLSDGDEETDCIAVALQESCNGLDDNCNAEVDEDAFGVLKGPVLICESCGIFNNSNSFLNDTLVLVWSSNYFNSEANRDGAWWDQGSYYAFYDPGLGLLEGPEKLSDDEVNPERNISESFKFVFYNETNFLLGWYSDLDRTDKSGRVLREANIHFKGEEFQLDEGGLFDLVDYDTDHNYIATRGWQDIVESEFECDPYSTSFGTCIWHFSLGYKKIVSPDVFSPYEAIFQDTTIGSPFPHVFDRYKGMFYVVYPKCVIIDRQWVCESINLLVFEGSRNPENVKVIEVDPDEIYPGAEAFRSGIYGMFTMGGRERVYATMLIEPDVPDSPYMSREQVWSILSIPLSYPAQDVEWYDLGEMENFCREPGYSVVPHSLVMERGEGDFLYLFRCATYREGPGPGEDLLEDQTFYIYGHSLTPHWPYFRTGAILPSEHMITRISASYVGNGQYAVLYTDCDENFYCVVYGIILGCK